MLLATAAGGIYKWFQANVASHFCLLLVTLLDVELGFVECWHPSYMLQTSTRAFEHSGFILRLILEENQIKFEPPFEDFELVLLNVYDVMVKASGIVPRVETKLYSEWVSWPLVYWIWGGDLQLRQSLSSNNLFILF